VGPSCAAEEGSGAEASGESGIFSEAAGGAVSLVGLAVGAALRFRIEQAVIVSIIAKNVINNANFLDFTVSSVSEIFLLDGWIIIM
jgi:hypothetical protein